MARDAWHAADIGRLDLAIKIIGRAVDLNPANPVLWHDQGVLLMQVHDEDKAASSFEAALQVAPDFADAYTGLAAVRVRQGRTEQAVVLQREAVRHAPSKRRHVEALAAYEALLAGGCGSGPRCAPETPVPATDDENEAIPADRWPDLAAHIEHLDWPEIGVHLTRRGAAHVPALLNPEQCSVVREMFDDDRRFVRTVTMNKSRFGRGVYRYFAAPIPSLVDALRQLFFPHLAHIANGWQCLLKQEERYPATWSAFHSLCAAEGQSTPSPLLLRYEVGGFNALHQDVRGEVFFPVQLVVVLSRRLESASNDTDAFTGGEFVFCDKPERKPSDRCAVPAGLGDAVLFCTRARLVCVGGAYGLKTVKHGLSRIESGTRYAIGIPFHDFR
ncbi:MAG TPA: 2OG-Fe(II) oxygenase [Pirellulales bacterium]|nr:2OG-Fe(II) oxygenase [Pirellulales bacterium]